MEAAFFGAYVEARGVQLEAELETLDSQQGMEAEFDQEVEADYQE